MYSLGFIHNCISAEIILNGQTGCHSGFVDE